MPTLLDHETRLRELEAFENKVKGAIWMLVFLNGISAGSVLYLLFRGG